MRVVTLELTDNSLRKLLSEFQYAVFQIHNVKRQEKIMQPKRFICAASGASNDSTLTIGLPALAITNYSPLAAYSINRDRYESWLGEC